MTNPCVFSPCRQYRYTLEHVWDSSLSLAMWIGLNPSTANEQQLDPTLRRIRGFTRAMGLGGFVMTNLFAFRATDPKVMKAQADPVGPDNDAQLIATAQRCPVIVAAWGAHGPFRSRDSRVRSLMLDRMHCLGTTKGGHPRHPLYVPASQVLIPYV